MGKKKLPSWLKLKIDLCIVSGPSESARTLSQIARLRARRDPGMDNWGGSGAAVYRKTVNMKKVKTLVSLDHEVNFIIDPPGAGAECSTVFCVNPYNAEIFVYKP